MAELTEPPVIVHALTLGVGVQAPVSVGLQVPWIVES